MQDPDGDDVTDDTPGHVGGANSEGQTEPTETEASTEEHETKQELAAEPGESAETAEGDVPADVVRQQAPVLVSKHTSRTFCCSLRMLCDTEL